MEPFINPKDTEYHKERQRFALDLVNKDLLPHRYVFILTNRCNLKCSFCFQEKSYIPGSMRLEDWMQVVDQLPDYAWVTMTGGEPFVFKEFNSIFNYIAKNHKCNIISNGLLLSEERINLLLSQPLFKVFSVSVDDISNKIRGVKESQWVQTEKMLNIFAERRDQLKSDTLIDAKTVVLDENAGEIFDIHRYCVEDLRCDTHSLQLLKGSYLQHADIMYDFEKIHDKSNAYSYKRWEKICEQFEKIRQYNLQNGKICYLHPKVANLNSEEEIDVRKLTYINQESHESANFETCYAPWESVHINVDGNIFPCMAIKMGNVKENTLIDILQSDVFRRFKDEIVNAGTVEGCNRCGYLRPKQKML